MSLTPDQERVISDIWQAKSGYELGVIAERERIIKLLDTLATQEPDYAQVFIHNLKVLIKGENK